MTAALSPVLRPRQLVLSGPPGVGKSTIARHVAEHLGGRAIDLDDAIRSETGRSPADILRIGGEPPFRAIERRTLERCDREASVLALGGGTLTDAESRR